MAAHFTPLPSIPPNKRVKVEIERKERKAPEIKDSQWVRDRQTLEKNKPGDVNEVLLMDDQEQLYEGMASNFLVVKDGAVVCASLDHILLGSILKIVIKVCEKHDIPLRWEFPLLQDGRQGKWEGCFLTSTSRLLLPIETILVDNERWVCLFVCGWTSLTSKCISSIEFKEASPLVEFLRKQVADEIYTAAYKVLP